MTVLDETEQNRPRDKRRQTLPLHALKTYWWSEKGEHRAKPCQAHAKKKKKSRVAAPSNLRQKKDERRLWDSK